MRSLYGPATPCSYTTQPWLKQLQGVVPALRAGKTEEGDEGTPVPAFPMTSPDVLLPGVSPSGDAHSLRRAPMSQQPRRLQAADPLAGPTEFRKQCWGLSGVYVQGPLLIFLCLPSPPPLQVYSLVNLAYAYHEIVSDYVTVALLWFESGCERGGSRAPQRCACCGPKPSPPASARRDYAPTATYCTQLPNPVPLCPSGLLVH